MSLFLSLQELEEQRQQNHKLYKDKLEAISQSKQDAQEEMNLHLEQMRQRLEAVN